MGGHFNKWEIYGNIENAKEILDEAIKTEIRNEVDSYRELVAEPLTKEAYLAKEFFDSIRIGLAGTNTTDLSNYFKTDNYAKEFIETAILKRKNKTDFLNFLIYAPENHFLRRFEEEAAIKPLGIKGEGLFKLFSIISSR